jgi:hypothetical protein
MSNDEQFEFMMNMTNSENDNLSYDESTNNIMDNDETTDSETTNTNTQNIVLNKEDCVSVSDIILNNVDKFVHSVLLNNVITSTTDQTVSSILANCNFVDYIVYMDTKKNIPCIYDCTKLYIPKSSVMDDNGNYLIESIEGRRSGFFIKLTNDRHFVMSKNFIYDIKFNNGKIENVLEYNRKQQVSPLEIYPINDFDSATLAVRNVLPKIVKKCNCTNIDELCEEVRKSYNSVDDINAMFKIVYLMCTIGA